MLPKIVDAVDGKIAVLFDSGIRTGVDVIKALSLGAEAVLIGRPVIYGLIFGATYVHVLTLYPGRSEASSRGAIGGLGFLNGSSWNCRYCWLQ
jgi:hypothetical protein